MALTSFDDPWREAAVPIRGASIFTFPTVVFSAFSLIRYAGSHFPFLHVRAVRIPSVHSSRLAVLSQTSTQRYLSAPPASLPPFAINRPLGFPLPIDLVRSLLSFSSSFSLFLYFITVRLCLLHTLFYISVTDMQLENSA